MQVLPLESLPPFSIIFLAPLCLVFSSHQISIKCKLYDACIFFLASRLYNIIVIIVVWLSFNWNLCLIFCCCLGIRVFKKKHGIGIMSHHNTIHEWWEISPTIRCLFIKKFVKSIVLNQLCVLYKFRLIKFNIKI